MSRHAKALLALLLLAPVLVTAQTAPRTRIENTARISWEQPAANIHTRDSNTVAVTTEPENTTDAVITLLRYVAGGTPVTPKGQSTAGKPIGAADLVLNETLCHAPDGSLSAMSRRIVLPGLGEVVLPLGTPLSLEFTPAYRAGDPVFIRIDDPDHNFDPLTVDVVTATVTVALTGDQERLTLTESGVDTGTFVGFIQSTKDPATQRDCSLSVESEAEIDIVYDDFEAREAQARILVDPAGRVFDSVTGAPVDGIVVELLDGDTGLPAQVFGDDGVSIFPAAVTTGGLITDSSGRTYQFDPGAFRFPFAPPGNYRLRLTTPETYAFPSQLPDADIQQVAGAPFALGPASRGDTFVLQAGPPIFIDVPLDRIVVGLFVDIQASQDVVAIGDFVRFRMNVTNTHNAAPAIGVHLHDVLPPGMRLVPSSVTYTRPDGTRVVPAVDAGANGRNLDFTLGVLNARQTGTVEFVAEVVAGAREGARRVTAQARAEPTAASNIAIATLQVRDELMQDRGTVMGEVLVGDCDAEEPVGLAGARLMLEDGTYVMTDARGRFNFRGVPGGTHVIQLDRNALPEGYEPVACRSTTRSAGKADSQFIELRPGSLARADFHVRRKSAPQGELSARLSQTTTATGESELVFAVQGGAVPVANLRLTLLLPEGASVPAGGVSVDGAVREDLAVEDGVLVARLGDAGTDWQRELRVRVSGLGATDQPRAVVTFDAPGGSNLRTPPLVLDAAAPTVVAVPGALPGQTILPPVAESSTGDQNYAAYARAIDAEFLASLDAEPAILWPQPDANPAIPAIKLAIKHHVSQQVSVSIDGRPLGAISLSGTYDAPDGVRVKEWTGVVIREGRNEILVEVRDAEGQLVTTLQSEVYYGGRAVRAEFVAERSVLVADGRTVPVVAVRLFDRFDRPVRPGISGQLDIAEPHRAFLSVADLQQQQLMATAPRETVYTAGDDGVALIPLMPTTQSGQAVLTLRFGQEQRQEVRAWLEAEARDWVLVGLAEGTVGHRTVSDNLVEYEANGGDADYYEDGRVAFYAKGRVKGEYLLTVAYDTRRDAQVGGAQFDQVIDPNAFYTLYGDASEQRHDAASREKLYLRLERKQFYALFGDYDSGLNLTELGKYTRRLTGAKSEYQGERFGYTAFVTENTQRFQRDQLQGDGTSGLYRLSRRPLVANSDRVAIEVRDRFHSERVIERRELTRFVDYSIDYLGGTLFFKEPVPSRDADFNPVYVVAEYETEAAGASGVSGGARGAVKLADGKAELGATVLREGVQGAEGDLQAVDLRVQVAPGTEFRAEFATSETVNSGVRSSGQAHLAELQHHGEQLSGRVYLREQEPGFGLGQQSGGETGMRKLGFEGAWRFDAALSAELSAYQQEALATGATLDVTEANLRWGEAKGDWSATAGFRRAAQETVLGRDDSEQVFAGGSLRVTDRVTLRASTEIGLGKSAADDFPDRHVVGLDYRVADWASLFAEHEMADGRDFDADMTRVGVRATPWARGQISTTMTQQATEEGQRTFATLGLTQGWQASEDLLLDFGFDRVKTLSAPGPQPINLGVPPASGSILGVNDFKAFHTGATLKRGTGTITSRLEYLSGDNEDRRGLVVNALEQAAADFGYSLGFTWMESETQVGIASTTANVRAGFVWRPGRPEWIVLDRLDLVYAEQEDPVAADITTWKLINNLDLNWRPRERLEVQFQHGIKLNRTTIDRAYTSVTSLYGVDVRVDLARDWDVGFNLGALQSHESGVIDYGAGFSVGHTLMDDVWLSVGYNVDGYYDSDFAAARYTARGPYIKFRVKFDGDSLKRLMDYDLGRPTTGAEVRR